MAQGMSADDQVRRARRWAEDEDAPIAKAALDALPSQVRSRVQAAASLGRALTIHKASLSSYVPPVTAFTCSNMARKL